jgi:transcriptional regulator with XRE-family HTH domain
MFHSSKKATHVFTLMNSILQQLKKRRLALGLKQNDMLLRVGVSRQQYQRLEAKGNPRLDTLELIAKGLNSELMLIPQEKLNAVLAVLESESNELTQQSTGQAKDKKTLSEDPWQGLLEDNQ